MNVNYGNAVLTGLIKDGLSGFLPGVESYSKMMPLMNGKSYRNLTPGTDAKQSAVLLLIRYFLNDIEILLTLRSAKLKNHSGQISFPGGKLESGESARKAALRETYEETGIEPDKIEILGQLSPLFVPPTNNIITPFVGLLTSETEIKINPDEVEEAFWAPLKRLNDPKTFKIKERLIDGKSITIPYYDIHPKTELWGATSMIITEFLWIYNSLVKTGQQT